MLEAEIARRVLDQDLPPQGNLRLIDGEELVRLLLQHYERFDSRYKGLLPLKRVYVPESLEEGTE